MSRSKDALEGLLTQWETLIKRRPNEGDFSAHGYPGITFDVIKAVFDRWESVINAIDEKRAWTSSPELALVDYGISHSITEIANLLASAKAHGVNWLAGSGFIQKIFSTHDLVLGLAVRRISIGRELAKVLATRAEENVDSVIEAAKSAELVIQQSDQVTKKLSEIKTSAEQAKVSTDELDALRHVVETVGARMDELSSAAQVSADAAARANTESTRLQKEIVQLKDSAIERESLLEAKVQEVRTLVENLEAEALNAKKAVSDALRLARDQGLAHSFQSRSKKLNIERFCWIGAFAAAAATLILVGITFFFDVADLTYESLIVALLRKASIIAPVIWVGWYCARQIGRVSKLQEDYEYKAASALAYQSYRDEASINPDNNLREELLTRAITTFGENPVRLYDETKTEVHTPMEDLLSKLNPDKLSDLLAAALAKALNKT